MANPVDNKFTWVIKDFPSLRSERVYSDEFVIDGCKWRLVAYPNGYGIKRYMSLYLLDVDSSKNGRRTKLRLIVVNQRSEKLSVEEEHCTWLDEKTPVAGIVAMIPHSKIYGMDGFLVKGELKIVVKVHVLQVNGKIDVLEESEDASRPLKKSKLNDDAESSGSHNDTPQVKETIDVNGFQVLPSQVEFVRKHADIAVDFRAKNQHLKKACMNVLLSLIETLCHSPQELCDEDLFEVENGLVYVKDAGFKVDWFEKRFEEVKEKKKAEQSGETRIRHLEVELKDMEALLEKEKAKLLATRSPLTLDDFA